MKVKVIIRFKDKYTHSWHEVGEILTVSEERYQEIARFVEVIKDEDTIIKKSSSKKNSKADSQD